MAGPQKRDAGGSPLPAHESDSATAEYVVARGRSLQLAGKLQGPGAPVDLPAKELDHLISAGFVIRVADQKPLGSGVRVGGLQIKGGKKPGGTVA